MLYSKSVSLYVNNISLLCSARNSNTWWIIRLFLFQYQSKAVPPHVIEEFVGERMHSSYSFLTLALDGVIRVTSRPRCTPGERTQDAHWIGGWVGPRAGLDTEATGKILCLFRESNPDSPNVQISISKHLECYMFLYVKRYKQISTLERNSSSLCSK
jgi:hypothetical protein